MTKAPEAAARLRQINEYLRDCEARIVKGELLELEGLDESVMEACELVANLPEEEGLTMEGQMKQLIESLESLSKVIEEQQKKLGE